MELTADLIRELAGTAFCRPAIAGLADVLADLTEESASALVRQLTEQGEAVALNRLLNVCAYREMRLDPAALAESASTIDDISHLPYCMKFQDAEIVFPLLHVARSPLLSWERQAVTARLATEFALRHETAIEETRRMLLLLHEEITHPVSAILVSNTLDMLETNTLKADTFPIMIDFDIQLDLPERPLPAVIGGGGTVRRPIAKLGRNDPCHCGSGKKYKRCCQAKDQGVLADASAYAGVTRTQLLENPGTVDDPDIIHALRAYEIKKLKAENLSTRQLWAAYHRAQDFDLFDIALDMLVVLSQRTDGDFPFDPGHFDDIMEHALARGYPDIAKRARAFVPTDYDGVDWDYVDTRFDLYANPGLVAKLEHLCASAFVYPDAYGPDKHDFYDLAHALRHPFPALSILFARAAVQQAPERYLDNELLVENVHQARIILGLDPWGDPIDDHLDASAGDLEREADGRQRAAEDQALREELARTREQAMHAARTLAEKEAALQALTHKLEAATQAQAVEAKATPAAAPAAESIDETKARVTHLRRQVENLKVEIGNQQAARKKLRDQLEQERQRARKAAPASSLSALESEEEEAPSLPPEKDRCILLPEYSSSFRDACGALPSSVVAKALKAIAGFAAYDAAAWQQARAIKQLAHTYRIRIGIHYRLLLRWLPGQTLTACDLIHRKELESWIKRQHPSP